MQLRLLLIFFIATTSCSAERILLTGGAGFIGSHLSERLLRDGHTVIIVDCLTPYYDPKIKQKNLKQIKASDQFNRLRVYYDDIHDQEKLKTIFQTEKPTVICHVAACAGVSPSLEKPEMYVHTNVMGTLHIFEMARMFGVKHIVFASSSSVYGQSTEAPFVEIAAADRPCSPYAVTKRAGELLAHTYTHLYGITCNCLRFFTVYGPRGRPDMAPFKFMDAIYHGRAITQFGDGSSLRDFTYIDDIVDGIVRGLDYRHGFEIFNLGRGEPVTLKTFIQTLEAVVGKKAKIIIKDNQAGDVPATHADIKKAEKLLGYQPKISLRQGLERMFAWYQENVT